MAKITYNAKVENGGATDDGLARAANFNEIKAVVNALDDLVALREPVHSFGDLAFASTNLSAAMNRGRRRFTHATPVLEIQTQAVGDYPAGFAFEGWADNEITITSPSGATINGEDAASEAIPGGVVFRLFRAEANAWVLSTTAAVDAATTSEPGLMSAADKTKLNGVAAGATVNSADAALVARANHTGTQGINTVTGLQAELDEKLDPATMASAIAADPDSYRTSLELGTAALLDTEDRDTATCYHILTQTAYGYAETGVAADTLVSGTLQLTPIAGAITHVYPLDPATSAELPEVAEQQANRPLNALVSVTDATSAAGEFELIYPTPVETAVLAGLENRVTQTRIVNDDPAATLTIKLAASGGGRRTARWRGALTDVELEPSDELLARAFWIAGDLDVDQFIRRASWATISVVSGSAGTSTSALGRSTPNALIGDLIVHQVARIGGQAITLPTGIGWAHPIIAPYGSDGRLLQPTPNRASRVTWTWATADGSFAPGSFTGATGARSMSAAYRGVAAVRQYGAAYGDSSTSIAWPALPAPRAPHSWVVGVLNVSGPAAAVIPAGATEDARYDAGSGNTSVALWHYAAGEDYAPASTTIASGNWACTVLELTPRRIS